MTEQDDHEPLRRVSDLLTPEEQAALNADLAEMAAQRRRALEASAFMVVGGPTLPCTLPPSDGES